MIGGAEETWASMLPKLFFVHFQETSFIIEEDGKTLGFYVDFFHKRIKMKRTFILSV